MATSKPPRSTPRGLRPARLLLVLLGLPLTALPAYAASYTSATGGNWSTAGTWTTAPGVGGPTTGDSVTLATTHALAYDSGASGAIGDITMATGSGALTLERDVDVSGTLWAHNGRAVALGSHTLTGGTLKLGATAEIATLTRTTGHLAVTQVSYYMASFTMDPLDTAQDLYNQSDTGVITTTATSNVTRSVLLTRRLSTGATLSLGAPLVLSGDLMVRESIVQDHGHNVTIGGTLGNTDGALGANGGSLVRAGGLYTIGNVSWGRSATALTFRPGDRVLGNFVTTTSFSTWPDLSVTQDPTWYGSALDQGLTLSGSTFTLGRTSAANQSEITLNWDSSVQAGVDWTLRWAGDHTAALRVYYSNGQILIGTKPASYAAFDPNVHIFYNGADGYTYVGYQSDVDADGYFAPTDCNDLDDTINPGATEVCDGLDNDCDGLVDEAGALGEQTFNRDLDADGYGDATNSFVACDAGATGTTDDTDCDDTDAYINPDAGEVCDGLDNDCNGSTDEAGAYGELTWYADTDGDGYGNAASHVLTCDMPSGYTADLADCDDTRSAVKPSALEVCSTSYDDNCDGTANETTASDATTWYADTDSDGYGDASSHTPACTVPSGYVGDATDCNDTNAAVKPSALEVCATTYDDNCDGTANEATASDAINWYTDTDADGYGDASSHTPACTVPSGYVGDATDCNDSNAAVKPSAAEVCATSYDDNCDGTANETTAVDAIVWYADADSDGYGNATVNTPACTVPPGYVASLDDCDDTRSSSHPGATETCDLYDNDCDGAVDEAGAVGEMTFYADVDQDDHGDAEYPSLACFDTAYTAASDDDCDDLVATVYTGALEYCNEVDDNCNGIVDDPTAVDAVVWYRDTDGDGHGITRRPVLACEADAHFVTTSDDCRPTDPLSYPGADEQCDSLDNDCDTVVDEAGSPGQPSWYVDGDGDHYGAGTASHACTQPSGQSANSTDCNDTLAAVNPGATEACNSYDDDCDGATDEAGATGQTNRYLDADGDGFGNPATALGSCNPIAGRINDGTDCDDAVNSTYPGAPERCDGGRNDCNIASWTSADEDGEVWLVNGSTWTSYTADWAAGTSASAVAITLPTAGILNVCDGTYYVRLAASSGTLSIEGMYADAVLSGASSGTVVTVSGASTNLSLSGLTIQDGTGSGVPLKGGGMRINSGNVWVDDCVFVNNTALGTPSGSGGGLYFAGGSLDVVNSQFTGNDAGSTGGGIYQAGGSMWLTDTDMTANTAFYGGGGYRAQASTFTLITRGEVSNNTSTGGGGGWGTQGTLAITGTWIHDNYGYSGGGLNHSAGTLTLTNTSVYDNTAAQFGGGLWQYTSGTTNCVVNDGMSEGFTHNTAAGGGGVYLASTSDRFTSTGCSFGADAATNNSPNDVRYVSAVKSYNYGNNATFTCTGGTCR